MKKIALLTPQQFRLLNNFEYAPYKYFGPSVAPDGSHFISEEEINDYEGEEFAWIKDLPLIEYSTELPDTTVPEMTGYGVHVPDECFKPEINLFPNNQFELNGFVMTFTPYSGGMAVDLAYFQWEAFRQEQLKPMASPTKVTFTTLWDTLYQKYLNQEIIAL